MKESVVDRFLRYVKIDTQSDEHSATVPSTEKQLKLANLLVEELKALGLDDAEVDGNGYVMATLPANNGGKGPVTGWIAHMDTSPDFTAEHVNPQIVRNYDGGEIILNKEEGIVLSPADFPELLDYRGQDLITTDGTTLLGADDKAGVAEIMTALAYLQEHPEVKHGTLRVAFTPDEEIGRGADHFDVKKFGADFAYTVDGGALGELEFENFNAALATITCTGRNVHPGTAKDKMINAMQVAMEYNALLPPAERPEHTEGYEGFYHLIDISGEVEKTVMRYLVRDHDRKKFEERKRFLKEAAALLRLKYGKTAVKVELKDQYYNMREKIEPVRYVVDLAREAMETCGVEPVVKPIRGGTDGARLSYMGLPTPNLFTGGHNFHGRYEFIPIPSMEKAVEVIIKISNKAEGIRHKA
jgi:tripeptide aminopeptidase